MGRPSQKPNDLKNPPRLTRCPHRSRHSRRVILSTRKFDPTNITVTGFAERGLVATVEQDDAVEEWVRLVVAQNAYGAWVSGKGLSGTDAYLSADPDGDGHNNLKEFALGGDPDNAGDQGTHPTLENKAGVMNFTYLRRVNPAAQGLSYTLLTTTDLGEPSSSWRTDGLGTPVVTPTDPASEFEWVTTPITTTAIPRRLVRLQIGVTE